MNGLSRTARISLLLVIDVFFFLLEIIVGYAVGSLALVADSFHMLNDVVSLVIALYAIKLTAQSTPSTEYSYGWHRAEILAALVNGVFLLALCFSITLEAVQRFFTTPEVSNPKLVVVVGSLGLASNIVGLFLFHEHGHEDHAHSPSKGAATSKPPSITEGPVTTAPESTRSPVSPRHSHVSRHNRERSNSYSSLYGHPAATRASFVQTANDLARGRSPSPTGHRHKRSSTSRSRPSLDLRSSEPVARMSAVDDEPQLSPLVQSPVDSEATERTPLVRRPAEPTPDPDSSDSEDWATEARHAHSHGHGNGSMNMKALLLHVMGDALGNVGVVATGLIIWLTSWSFKYYFDPIISLVITVIIFHSALPLVRSTSFILLQGVPSEVSLEAVREQILTVEGVLSVHELHIWQLSESKIIASVHVTASRSIDFMPVASDIRKILHHHGIHSSTIQPEYHPHRPAIPDEFLKSSADTNCLISCPADQACNPDQACCPHANGSPPEP
ncbi:cation efflux protein [Artomyces pyxidatus]|uniref:Cation efflux protein n=1 Tax=Artomyces pyxidatus TaxID=48021 RepID=A0ACB8TH66_9AGAM|nr:cation efflux protein [Artomyces pyxidatus]